MIETKFIKNIVKEYQIEEFILENLRNAGFARSELQKTPLGEKIIIYASRPGLIVGRKGENIQKLTKTLKIKFKLENPQIEIVEVQEPMLNAQIVADKIATSLERFGLSKFKGIGHKSLTDTMGAGAKGIEIIISGKIPSSRAKRWRFYQGYLKKSGDIAVTGIKKAYVQAKLKTGIVGVQVRIMPPDLTLPDTVTPLEEVVEIKTSKTTKEVLKDEESSIKKTEKEDTVKNDTETNIESESEDKEQKELETKKKSPKKKSSKSSKKEKESKTTKEEN
jgi:small subunit ribosomal protein S3